MRILFLALLLFSSASFAQTALRFKVEGMDCPFCASKIEKEISNLEGLESFQINMKTEMLRVQVKDSSISSSKIVEAIRKAGFAAEKI